MMKLELLPNKIVAIALLVCGLVPMLIGGDGTALIIFGIMSIYMFFARTNCTCIELTPTKKTTTIYQYPIGENYGEIDEHEQRLLS